MREPTDEEREDTRVEAEIEQAVVDRILSTHRYDPQCGCEDCRGITRDEPEVADVLTARLRALKLSLSSAANEETRERMRPALLSATHEINAILRQLTESAATNTKTETTV